MEASATNLGVMLGLLLVLLLILGFVVFVLCRQTRDDVFPKSSVVIRGPKESNSSVDSLRFADGSEQGRTDLPNVPKIIVTTASMRQKHI